MGEQEDGGGKVRRAELRLLVERTVKLAPDQQDASAARVVLRGRGEA